MFWGATSFNGDLSSWNTSSVTNMLGMFWDATSFNGDLSSWNTSSVTNTLNMFYNAESFNGDVSAWNTSSVENMSRMFKGATSFNRDLSAWDTSSVTNMWGVFYNATSFNGNISAWDTSSVTSMYAMFYNATSFNQDLCAWRDAFPSCNADDIFANSGCTYQGQPQEDQKGPFCASDCTVSTSVFVCCVLCSHITFSDFVQITATFMHFILTAKCCCLHRTQLLSNQHPYLNLLQQLLLENLFQRLRKVVLPQLKQMIL